MDGHPTGYVTVSVDAEGQPSYVIHRPAAYDFAELDQDELAQIAARRPDWISFGTLHQMDARGRKLTRHIMDAAAGARRFYDVNLRRDSYDTGLVADLLGVADAVKLNDAEVAELGRLLGLPCGSPEEFCRANAGRFGWQAACVTRGAAGCSVLVGDDFAEAPGYAVAVADTVGAGDAFAAAFLHSLGAGWQPEQIGDFANRVGALVASRPGAIPEWTLEEIQSLDTC